MISHGDSCSTFGMSTTLPSGHQDPPKPIPRSAIADYDAATIRRESSSGERLPFSAHSDLSPALTDTKPSVGGSTDPCPHATKGTSVAGALALAGRDAAMRRVKFKFSGGNSNFSGGKHIVARGGTSRKCTPTLQRRRAKSGGPPEPTPHTGRVLRSPDTERQLDHRPAASLCRVVRPSQPRQQVG